MAKRKLMAAANRVIWQDIGCLAIAVACAVLGLEGFLLPGKFLDGGVTGIALTIRQLTGWPLALLIFVFNLPFIVMGRYQISTIFAVKTFAAVTILSLCLWLVHVPPITADPLLVAVFGGFFLGLGIGFAIRGGGVIDGTEVLALYIARYTPMTLGQVVLVLNVVIFSVAAFVFSMEEAMYAILTYLSASKTADFILRGLDEYMALQIFSEKNSAVLHKVLTRSLKLKLVTIETMRGDPSKPEKSIAQPMLYTVVSRLQIPQILQTVHAIDRKAAVVYHPVTDFQGKP